MLKIRLPPEWGIDPVPREHKILGTLDYFVLWSSLGVGLLVIAAGSLLTPALSFGEAVWAIIVGSLIGSILLSLTGIIGSRHSVPTMVSARPSFGLMGSYFPTSLNVLQLIGWTIFEIIIMAQAADTIAAPFIGVSSFPLWVIFFGLVLLAMGFVGPIAIVRQWLEKFAIWIVYATSAWIIYYFLSNPLYFRNLLNPGAGGLSLAAAVDIVIAMPISWMPLVADYNRFAKTDRAGFLGTFSGYSLANIWFYAIGVILVLATGSADVVSAVAKVGFGTLVLLMILVDEPDNAWADAYSAAVSSQNILPRLRQRWLLTAYVVLSTVLALIIPIVQYENFLLLIGSAFIPAFGVVLADYYLVRQASLTNDSLYPDSTTGKKANPKAILAWILGALTYYLLSPISPIYLSFAPEMGASIPSLAVASLTYLVISKIR